MSKECNKLVITETTCNQISSAKKQLHCAPNPALFIHFNSNPKRKGKGEQLDAQVTKLNRKKKNVPSKHFAV